MSINILLVGSGAREHAIVRACSRSKLDHKVFCIGSGINPGIAERCADFNVADFNDKDIVTNYAKKNDVHLAIIGPENPLQFGIADALWENEIKVFGPTKSLARIETSKGFARTMLRKYDIPGGPNFKRFSSLNGVKEFCSELQNEFVIKFDGLAGGKGVKVFGEHLDTISDALSYCKTITDKGGEFLIEQKFYGEEFSLMSFCDGINIQHMPVIQDHKRAYENDTGPNTGGMGTYSDLNHSLPFLDSTDLDTAKKINEMTMLALKEETGMDYMGVLYGGFMAVKDGVRLIEYNARFGDPEAMNVLSILNSDFIEICKAITEKRLCDIDILFDAKATVCKYAVPEGYPDTPVKGHEVDISQVKNQDSLYFASVDIKDGKLIESGSRTLAAVSVADTIGLAEQSCEETISKINGPLFHRKDIGTQPLITKRIENMKKIRC